MTEETTVVRKRTKDDINLNDKQKKLLDRVKYEAHKIAHLVGFTKLNEMHAKWIAKMVLSKEMYVLKGHRGSMKTSCLIVAIALMVLLKPDKTIIFLRKTDNDVKEVVEKVSKILHTDVFQYFAQIIYGHGYTFTKDTAFAVSTSLKTTLGGDAQLLGMGINGSLTGKHADIVIVDDIVNLKDRTSRAEREHTKQVWMELRNVQNPDGRSLCTGTTWHPDDAFSLMPQAEIWSCYDTGLLSKKQIEEIKRSMSPALFAANYELKFVADEDAVFTDIRYFRNCDLTDEQIKLQVKPKDLLEGGISHVDASYGGNDTTALTIMRKLSDGRIIAYGKVWDKHVKHCMNDIITLCNFYLARNLWLETNGDKGYLGQEFRQRNMKVMTYHEKMNKDLKIQTYLYGSWQDIYWLEETDPKYINQIMDYTENAEIVDAPDSAACACRLLTARQAKAIEGLQI